MFRPLPSSFSYLRRKILIKNKRLRPDDERREMDLWLKGQLQNEESDGEADEHDANAINVTGKLLCRWREHEVN